jgi:hypothetical protein
MYYEGCKLSNSFGIISWIQANRGGTGTGSRYAGKKCLLGGDMWEKNGLIKVWISETKMVSQ